MNNRKRARIKELKRECKSEMDKRESHSAKGILWWLYQEKIDRVAWGDDMADKMFRDFMNLTRGEPYKRNLIWKKAARTVKFAPMSRRLVGPIFG